MQLFLPCLEGEIFLRQAEVITAYLHTAMLDEVYVKLPSDVFGI